MGNLGVRPIPAGARVRDLDDMLGFVEHSHVVDASLWGWARSCKTRVRYDDGETHTVVEFEDDAGPSLFRVADELEVQR